MIRNGRHVVTGHIVAIQEERFRLMTDSGNTLLLTLGKFSKVSSDDLCQWHAEGAHVSVDYQGEPNLASGIALSVKVLENGKAKREERAS